MKSVIHILLVFFYQDIPVPKKNILTANKRIIPQENFLLKNVLMPINGLAKQLHTTKKETSFTKRNCGQSADMLLLNLHFIRTEHSVKPH